VRFIPAKCFKTKEGLLIKIIRDEAGWCWDSTLKDGAIHGTTHSYVRTEDISFDAPLRTGIEFRCVGCGNKDVVKCNSCKQITCWRGKGLWKCAFCRNSGHPSGQIKSASAISEGKKK